MERERLQASNKSLSNSTQMIKEMKQSALETEEIGASILHQLQSDREKIRNAQNSLAGMNANLKKSDETLKSMTGFGWFKKVLFG